MHHAKEHTVSVILESMCTKGTGGTYIDWTLELRSFANMKLQLPHHRGGHGITLVLAALFPLCMRRQLRKCNGWVITAMPSRISPISQTFGRRGRTCPIEIPGQHLFTALQCAHALLLADYKCMEWVPAERPVSGAAPAAIADPANPQNPTAGGTRPSKPPSALPSLVVSPLSMLSESSRGEG